MRMHTVYQLALSATIFTVLLTGGILSPRAATAATYYVATTGSDSNPGTQSAPFGTIKKGLGSMQAGDTLYLRGGTYSEGINSNDQTIPTGTSWANPVTIAAYPQEQVILAPTSGGNVLNLYAYNTSYDIQYLIFDGLIMDGTNVSGETVGILGDEGGSGHTVHHVRFQNGQVRNAHFVSNPNTNTGFPNVHMKAHDVTFSNSRIHHALSGYGFYMIGSNITIDNCEVDNNYGYGIQQYSSPSVPGLTGIIIKNSRIHDNGTPGNVFGGAGMTLNFVSNMLVSNNLIYNNPYGGINISYGNPNNVQIYNNTFYNNATISGHNPGVIYIFSGVTNTQVKNNIFWGNGAPPIDDSGSGTVQAANLTNDPKFVNPSGGDFSLQATSPAIDAGTALSTVPTDFKGTSRPQGVRYDIGAYEYQVSTVPTPISTVPTPKNLKAISVAP